MKISIVKVLNKYKYKAAWKQIYLKFYFRNACDLNSHNGEGMRTEILKRIIQINYDLSKTYMHE